MGKEAGPTAGGKTPGAVRQLATGGGIFLSLFHLFTAYYGVFDAIIQRSIHLGLVLFIGFLSYPVVRRPAGRVLLALAGLFCSVYLLFIYEELFDRMGVATHLDLTLGIVTLVIVLVVGLRSLGWPLPVLTSAFLVYALYGHVLPSFLGHKGMPWDRLVSWQYITTEGLWGIPLGVMATFVFLFVLYGALLTATGAGELIMDVALGLTGRARGGPAKVAVISSSLFGTISGSVVANVVSTGTFTIPLMKRVGYPAHYAGGVEAVASTGGLIMPPVMGAAAFVMADIMGVGYAAVVKAALIPALLYYAALFTQLHLRAVSTGIRGLGAEELPAWRKTVRRRWHLVFSPAILVYLLFWENASAMKSVFWAIVTLAAVSSVRAETRLTPGIVVRAFTDAGRLTVPVTLGCALAGIIMGVVTITGLGLKFATGVVDLAGGSLPLLLGLLMIASLILGMGVTATVAYLLPAIIVAPVLVKMGVAKMAAHFFCFYFASISYITPPVAIGAYAAAGLAQASPMKTGWAATKLGIVGFLVPFLFVSHPSLLLEGNGLEILGSFATALIGVVVLAMAMEGWLLAACTFPQRALLAAGGFLMMKPGYLTDVAGLLALATVYAWQKLNRKRRKEISSSPSP